MPDPTFRRPLAALTLTLAAVALAACGGAQITDEQTADPELVLMDGALSNDFVTASTPSEVLSRIRVETRGLPGQNRPPINLALVVDTSGSMDGAAMNDARAASLSLLEILHPEDRLTVVAFHSETEVLLESTQLGGADVDELRSRIAAMEARGTTDLAGGLRAGLEELVRHYEPDGINRLVLLSDGVPNDASPVIPMATAAGERGIRITALGLGVEYDETLLGGIAQASGGRFHYVEQSSQVAAVFSSEVLRFERLVARNLALTLRPGPGVEIVGVVGRSVAAGADGSVVVSLGDLSEGEQRDVIVRLQSNPHRPGATVELMDAVLRFDDAAVDAGSLERRVFLGARATQDPAELEAGRNEDIEREARQVIAAAETVHAIQVARAGDLEEARRALDRARAESDRAPAVDRAREMARIDQLEQALPAVAPVEASADEDYAPPRPSAAPTVREAHDSAMEAIGY